MKFDKNGDGLKTLGAAQDEYHYELEEASARKFENIAKCSDQF